MKSIKKTRSQFETRVFYFAEETSGPWTTTTAARYRPTMDGHFQPPRPAAIREIYTSISCMVTTRAFRNKSPNTGIRRDIALFNIYDLSTNAAYLF